MAVAARSTADKEILETSGTGRMSNVGRAAGLGASIGGSAGIWCYYLVVICAPVGAVVGSIGGAAYGAVVSEDWQEADKIFRTIAIELDLNRALPEHLVTFSRSHGYEIVHVPQLPPQDLLAPASPERVQSDDVTTLIEIQDLTVSLVPAEFMVNPFRRLVLSAHVQLIRTHDRAVIDDRVVTDTLGPALALDSWSANNASRFREEVTLASHRLAEDIIAQYFMTYRFSEKIVSSDFLLEVRVKGLRALSPLEVPGILPFHSTVRGSSIPVQPEFHLMARRADSLQPTLRWEPLLYPDVTYEIRVWRAGKLGPEAVVYSRTDLKNTEHVLEMPLEPSTPYYWSVRAHFSLHGKGRITEWSRRTVRHALSMEILTAGIAMLLPNPVNEGFYVFVTP